VEVTFVYLPDPTLEFTPGIHMYAQERANQNITVERDEEFYYLSFRLKDSFVNTYKERKPAWGFPVGGNVTLGEVNWVTKYSARKLDGSKERFWEGLRRVIEGVYSIQKDHAMRFRLPWDENMAHTSAQEAYERCFTGKWSPPGRGFWKMGSFFVNGLGDSSALQNCFVGSTRFVTFEGVRTLEDSVGESVDVWTNKGWYAATVESFGRQPVQRITFAPFNLRSNIRTVEVATPNHRWELRDGSTTTSLTVGDIVPAAAPIINVLDEEGLRHGLIFGDGSITYRYVNGDYSHAMRLCGPEEEHSYLFTNLQLQPNCNGDLVAYYRSPTNMKALPVTADPIYLHNFILGWAMTDGVRLEDGHRTSKSFKISTQDALAAQWLEDNAAAAGFIMLGHNTDPILETNYGRRSAPCHRLTLLDARNSSAWKVVAIELLDEPEEVYCAVVPNVERFTLASGIYTSNCAFISTGNLGKSPEESTFPFHRLMEMSMLGIGVGFDTKGAGKVKLYQPKENGDKYFTIPDSREGWCESVNLLLGSYFSPRKHSVAFDYSALRPRGDLIKGFGGKSAGPEPLIQLHKRLRNLLDYRQGEKLTSSDIVDIQNMIGKCVVAANVRSSAEIALGDPDDIDYINLKNPMLHPERMGFKKGPDGGPLTKKGVWVESDEGGWGYTSNNSVLAEVGGRYDSLGERIRDNGEPGVVWLDVCRRYGRLIDPPTNKDYRVAGVNPCAEQPLEHNELCTLVETYPTNCKNLDDYLRTLKFAYLYGKTVTLLATHWSETNEVMIRNRRIGTGMSGIAQFVETQGWAELRRWQDAGYKEIRKWDEKYSEWLGVRESIKVTTVKPSGTVSLLFGVTPGAHWPTQRNEYLRRLRLTNNDPMAKAMEDAGFPIEPNVQNPQFGLVVTCPTLGPDIPSEREVSLYQKVLLAVQCQEWWSDNAVSLTASFLVDSEGPQIASVLQAFDGKLKSISFLPMSETTTPFAQMPYETVSHEEWQTMFKGIGDLDWDSLYAGEAADAAGELYCSNDSCEIV
jgi:ribonucleoside-triphosphate reductase (thioredoxin)